MGADVVVPGLFRIVSGYVNAYAIQDAGEITLIDTGLPGKARRILVALRELGREPREMRRILVTHHHVDHAGSLGELVRATGAEVWVHVADADVVRGERPSPRATRETATGRILGPLLDRMAPGLQPCAVDHELSGGEDLEVAGLQAIHAPGHTAGELAFRWDRRGGVLIAGDAARNLAGLGPPDAGLLGTHTEDRTESRRSFAKLAALDFDAAVFGHGAPIVGGASARFREAAARRGLA